MQYKEDIEFTNEVRVPTAPEGTSSTIAASTEFVSSLVSNLIPVGSVISYAGPVSPYGWLLCNGNSYDVVTYPELFDLIGYTYGGSSSLFKVPDLRIRVPIGVGTGYPLASLGGSATHTLTVAQLPAHNHTAGSHSHTINDPGHTHTYLDSGTGQENRVIDYGQDYNYSSLTRTTNPSGTGISINSSSVTIGNTGSGQAHNNMQPYIVLNYIIKAS